MDLIKRQDAIDAVMDTEAIFSSDSLEPYQKTSDVILALEKLPSAQQWVPCSERLPEIDVFVLVTLQHFNGEIDVVIAKVIKDYCSKELAWESDDGEWTWGIKHGIAWMPLPESYKQGKE